MNMGGPPMDGPPMGGPPMGGPPGGGGNNNPLTGPPPPLNEDGLPVRPDKEPCLYYLNTGTCRSGTQCIFHHPPKVEREQELKKSLNKAGMPPPPGGMMPPNDGPPALSPPVAPVGAGMPPPSSSLGMAGMLEKLEALQAENQPPSRQNTDNDEKPWEYIDGPGDIPGGAPDKPKIFEPPQEVVYNEEGLPIRPGMQKCSSFLRSGKCTYGPTCRFDHPAGLGGLMASAGFGNFPGMVGGSSGMIGGPMTEGGMAMRPGRDQCPFLARTGTCPFGPECRFDHSGKPTEDGAASNPNSLSRPVVEPVSRKKEKGLGGTRGRRPPPSGNRRN